MIILVYKHSEGFNKFIDTLDLNAPKKPPTNEATEKLYYHLIYSEMMKEVK